MSANEIRRRRTGDPEMDAIAVLSDVLEPLDRPARRRILHWANERFVKGEFDKIAGKQTDELMSYFEKVDEMAKDHGLNQRQFMQVIAQLREREEVAPADPPLPAEKVEEAIQQVKT